VTSLLLALALSAPLGAQEAPPPADPRWAVSCSRLLGASTTVRERAWRVRQSAEAILSQGRASHHSAVVADARELDQAVASALLAAQSTLDELHPG